MAMRERYRDERVEREWVPQTQLGKQVLEGAISISDVFRLGKKVKEPQIIEHLLPDLRTEIIMIGESPGKGGGSRKTPTKRTARMHSSGRRYKISSLIAVGNGNGYIGIGHANAKNNKSAISKATEKSKLNVLQTIREKMPKEKQINPCDNCYNKDQIADKRCVNCFHAGGMNYARSQFLALLDELEKEL